MSITLLKTKFGDVEYSIIGKGRPVFFVHGGHSNCHDTLCHKGFDLEYYQLITPSRPGYGKTPLGKNKTPRQAAELLIEILNHLRLRDVVVYGVSAGGLTAIELARHYPDRVNKLILASSVSKKWLNKNSKIYRTAKIIFNPKIEKFTWKVVRFFSTYFPRMIASSFFSEFSTRPAHKLNSEDIEELVSMLNNYSSGEGFLNDIDQNIEVAEQINAIVCPTLVIHSKNDNSVTLDHAENAKEIIALSTLTLVDNEWGHLLWLGKDSAATIKTVMKFIKAGT